MYNFLKTPSLTLLANAVFSTDHDKIIKFYIFSQNWGLACILGAIIILVAKKTKPENDNKWGPIDVK